MKEYFDEKARQIDCSDLVSFGIPISSRYGKAHELAEMLLFTRELAL